MASQRARLRASPPTGKAAVGNGAGGRKSAPAGGSQPTGKVADLWLGLQLRSLRKAKELSLAELAAAADLSIGMVSQIERGLASPSIRSLRKLGEALGVPISWFLHANTGRPAVESNHANFHRCPKLIVDS